MAQCLYPWYFIYYAKLWKQYLQLLRREAHVDFVQEATHRHIPAALDRSKPGTSEGIQLIQLDFAKETHLYPIHPSQWGRRSVI